MTHAYYNENDEFAADWLRNLIKTGLIADGEVDTRSIVDVRPSDLAGFGQCHFFAGIGGWSYALRSAGWPDDIVAWTGSCPCQPFSLAGKQKGFSDERHLWPIWRELIRECNPAIVFGEQVASATEWLGLVRGDLEAMGRAVGAMPIQAASAGADHLRDRYWFVAYAGPQRSEAGLSGSIQRQEGNAGIADNGSDEIRVADANQPGSREERQQRSREFCGAGCNPEPCAGDVGYPCGTGAGRDRGSLTGTEAASGSGRELNGDRGEPAIMAGPAFDWVIGADGKARRVKPGIRLLAHGIPNRVGLLRGFGNAIDHRPAKDFIIASMEALTLSSQQGNPQ